MDQKVTRLSYMKEVNLLKGQQNLTPLQHNTMTMEAQMSIYNKEIQQPIFCRQSRSKWLLGHSNWMTINCLNIIGIVWDTISKRPDSTCSSHYSHPLAITISLESRSRWSEGTNLHMRSRSSSMSKTYWGSRTHSMQLGLWR